MSELQMKGLCHGRYEYGRICQLHVWPFSSDVIASSGERSRNPSCCLAGLLRLDRNNVKQCLCVCLSAHSNDSETKMAKPIIIKIEYCRR